MGAAGYIGRVGGLAVALGVGTAIATGYGIAAADDTSTGTSTSSASTSGATSGSDAAASAASDGTAAVSPGTDAGATESSTVTTPGTPASTSASSSPADPSDSAGAPSSSGASGASGSTTSTTIGGVVVSAQSTTGSSGSLGSKDTALADEPATVAPQKQPSTAKKSKSAAAEAKSVAVTQSVPAQTSTPAATEPPQQTPSTTKTAATVVAAATAAEPAAAVARVAQVAVQPVTTAATASQNPLAVVGSMVSGVVDWMLRPLLGAGATPPAQPPLAWSLLAFARREFDHFVAAVTGQAAATPAALQTTSLAQAAVAAVAAVNVPNFPLPGAQLSPSTQFVQWVTGNYQTGNPLIADTQTRFSINGTDVGVIWDNGMVDDPTTPFNEHQVLMAFGDTFSGANMTGNWRFNVLLRSADTVLSDGITIPNGEWFNGNMFGGTPLSTPTTARQIIHPDGLPAGITLIPTAGISIPTPGTQFGVTQYVNFMSVTNWGAAGTWTTNYSAIAYSTDNGENWTVAPKSVRYNQPFGGNANFQQGAFVRPGDGYVYDYGTPNGRQGAAYVSRVVEKDILDTSKYEYYSKGSAGGWFGIGATKAGWYKNNPAAATAIFGQDKGSCGVAKPGNQVSEMSVQFNKQLNKYVVLHGDQFNNIVMRTSDTPQGTWSAAKVLMAQQSGGIYAPMMHPWSPATMGTGTDLYWNLSLYSEYNVMLMKTDLTKV